MSQLRWQSRVPLLASTLCGIGCGRVLLHLGVESLLVRNAIVFPLAYAFLFACVHLWRKVADTPLAHPTANGDRKRSWLNHLSLGADSLDALVVLAAIIGFIWVAVWFFGEAPAIIEDALFDVGSSANLASALQRAQDWHLGLFRKTILPFLIFYASSAVLLFVVHQSCPQQTTIARVLRECWMRP